MLYNVYKPTFLQTIFNRYFVPVSPIKEPDRIILKYETFGKSNFVSYYIPSKIISDTCIIWFHGGCFLQKSPDNVMPFLELLSATNHVYTFDYPTLFDFTLDDTILFIQKNLRGFFDSMKFENYVIGGDSAGTFLALKVYEAELLNACVVLPELRDVNGFIGICGFYDRTFGDNILMKFLFEFYVLRGVKNKSVYNTSISFPNNLLVTATSDFLNEQTIRYNDKYRGKSRLLKFTTPNSQHCFINSTSLSETTAVVKEIELFISEIYYGSQ